MRVSQFYKEAQNFAASFEKTTTPAKLVEVRARTKINGAFLSDHKR